jgi:hypothetical protein
LSRKKKRKTPVAGKGASKLPAVAPDATAASATTGEARNSVAVTVAWMLATLCTAIASGLTVVSYSIVRWGGEAADANAPLGFFPGLMLLIAGLTGIASLGLIPVVYRVRPIAPPRSITIAAVLIGALPLVILLVLLLL